MGLLEQARSDIKQALTNLGEFGVSVKFTAPNQTEVTVTAMAIKHHLGINLDTGLPANVKTARVTVVESVLTAANYPVRNSKGEVSLINHKVEWTDSSATSCKYIISEQFPDESLGLIVCTLRDYE